MLLWVDGRINEDNLSSSLSLCAHSFMWMCGDSLGMQCNAMQWKYKGDEIGETLENWRIESRIGFGPMRGDSSFFLSFHLVVAFFFAKRSSRYFSPHVHFFSTIALLIFSFCFQLVALICSTNVFHVFH